MSGIIELEKLLASISPKLCDHEYVFCSVSGELAEYVHLKPLATFLEPEGLTLLVLKEIAEAEKLVFESVFKQITLNVHSSLDAVGLTAAVTEKLTSQGISANVLAAYYHDHIFVQSDKALAAMTALEEFQSI